MRNNLLSIAAIAVLCLLAAPSAFGTQSEEVEAKGIVISRTGETLIVKDQENNKVTVVLTDQTETKDDKGLLGMRKEYMANTVLIPGLKLKVKGDPEGAGRIIAKTITIDGDDLETAEMIQAGLHPTAQQVQKNTADIEQNTDRFSQLSDYDVKGNATVNFAVGSSKLSSDDTKKLKQLAQTTTGLKGYIIEVKGYTDASGSAAMNQKLSEDRADAVVAYLIQQCNVPVRHIVAPGAMGEYQPAASNETQQGRAENRRVDVKVLTNKVIAGE